MKKKIINGIMMVALVAATSTSFVSCKDTNEDVKIEQAAEIAQLKGRLTTLENKYGDLDSRISALSARVDNHADAIETLQKEVDNLEIWLLETFSKLVTSVEISGTYNNMTGSINIPGFEPKMLISNYGEATKKGSFPKSAKDFGVEPIEWAQNEVLGEGEENPGFAGYIYATINRYIDSVPMLSKEDDGFFTFSLVNTAGVEVPGLIVENVDAEGDPTDDVLQWGWTRADDNNIYKFGVAYNGADAKGFTPAKIDLSKLKEDLKQVWRDRNRQSGTSKQALGHLVADLYYNYATKDTNMAKYALKVAWTDNETEADDFDIDDDYEFDEETETIVSKEDKSDMEGVAHKTTSEAELVFATIKPLSFESGNALGEKVNSVTKSVNNVIDKLEPYMDKILNKFKKQLKLQDIDFDYAVTTLGNIEFAKAGTTEGDLAIAGGIPAGHYYVTNDNKSAYVDVDEIVTASKEGFESAEELVENIKVAVGKVNGTNIGNWVEKFTNKANKLFQNHADQILRPCLLVIDKDGNVNRVSGLKEAPYTVAGEVTLKPTTYTAELMAPAYAKFVGCKDITAAGFNEIIKCGSATKAYELKFTPEKGKLYEIVYEAVDFFGNTYEHTYYIQGK